MTNSPDNIMATWYAKTICGQCKAGRLLQWGRHDQKGWSTDRPLHSVYVDEDTFAAVHCDYFRRRIESPDQLTTCEAMRKRA